MNDAQYFTAYVEYFRGATPITPIRPATNWRILVPAVASILPFSPLTALNLVNLLCLGISIFFLFNSMQKLSINNSLSWMGCWLFICSFPTFYYTTIGYVDPGVMLFVSTGIYFTLTQNFGGLLFSVALGALAKETIVVIIPFIFMYTYCLNKAKAILWTIALLALFLLVNVLLRQLCYISPNQHNPTFWKFSIDALLLNMNRFNSYAAPILSFGVPGLLFLWLQTKKNWNAILTNPLLLATWSLLVGVFLLFCTTIIATYCDGRIIWQASYALIIASMWSIQLQYKNILML